jgi:malate/lactate dehydrogenase
MADGVWLGLPAIIGTSGLVEPLPLALDEVEKASLTQSAGILRKAHERLGPSQRG